MSIIVMNNISHSFGDKVVLKNVDLRLLKGEHVGLVGANGSGKTTLLNILTGKLLCDEGEVKISKDLNIGYMDQHKILKDKMSIEETLKGAFSDLYNIESKIIEIGDSIANAEEGEIERLVMKMAELQDKLTSKDFYSIDSYISNVANGLGLDALGMETTVNKLSGGQLTKVVLARLLLNKPEILLLDEPTNYLDKEHVDWLTEYLQNYEKCFIVISHDTQFLNNITTVIYNLEFNRINRYPGNYEYFLRRREEDRLRYIEQYNSQQEKIEKLEDFVKKNLVRASTTKRAQSRQKVIDKIERLEKPKNIAKPNFSFVQCKEPYKEIFSCKKLTIGYEYPLMKSLNFKITKGDKIAVTGCNGIGKSTFMKTIMGLIPPISGELVFGEYISPVYFEQDLSEGMEDTAIQDVWNSFPKMTRVEIRTALARCGLKEEHIFQKMKNLSGGEQAKVRLCKLMLVPSNWLVLDEPTNHLDVLAKNALRESLINYSGTILLVCHEKEFYEDWITTEWNMEKYI